MEVIVTKQRNVKDGQPMQQGNMQKEAILNRLRQRGCRITKQRMLLLDIILEEECSSCKEIYYKASKIDSSIGSATVYRMINMLPFTPKRIEIVETYDDIPIYLATGMYITLLRPYVYLSNDKNIRSFPLSDDYDLKQGITMIWFGNNKNPYLKKMVSIMSRRE